VKCLTLSWVERETELQMPANLNMPRGHVAVALSLRRCCCR